jgi:drug/metabolite transporter (DMT)-like permease
VTKNISKNRAAIELVFAGVLWGFGFLAVKWALLDFSVADVLFFRYLFAFFLGELYLLAFDRKHFLATFKEWRLALWPGLLMAAFIIPQTIGLNHTTATKSGFITTLYVLMVPFLNQYIFKVKIDRRFYSLALIALIGTVLLLDVFSESSNINIGDWWTFGCAIMAALQIIVVGKYAPLSESPFRFNSFQNFWTLLCVTPLFLLQEKITWFSYSLLPWLGLIELAIGSSIIAFTIQIRAQKVLSPETASQFFLLESPFAFLFGYMFLKETLTPIQLIGAGMILLTTYLTLKLEQTSHSK